MEDPTQYKSLLYNAIWTLSNLVRYKPPPSVDTLAQILPTFAKILDLHESFVTTHKDVIIDCLWGISYICGGPESIFDAVIEGNILQNVVSILLNTTTLAFKLGGLRILGNITTGSDFVTQSLIEVPGFFDVLVNVLNSDNSKNIKEVCWLISNIAAGTHAQVEILIDSGVVSQTIQFLNNTATEAIG